MKHSSHRKNMLFVSLLLGSLIWGGGCAVAAEKSPWSFIGFTKYRDALFIDKTRLTRSASGKVLVSVLIKPSPKSLFRNSIKKEIPQYRTSLQNFQYLVLVMEMACTDRKMRFLVIQFRDDNDKVLQTTTNAQAPWKQFKPGSLWKDLEGAVCP
ncbi:MAG: hypothetical protein WC405_13170 [Syntrophales bacterium]